MTDIIKFPGSGLVRPTKKGGHALIGATLHALHPPLTVAARCQSEFRSGVLLHVNDTRPGKHDLPNATANLERMLPHAAMVTAARAALLPVIVPPTLTVTRDDAVMMLTVLFGALGNKKGSDPEDLLRSCLDMLDPDTDALGEITAMWRPVSKHPVILALAVRSLPNTSVFVSPAELRTAMHEARRSIVGLADYCGDWLDLLRLSDRVVFEHDRGTWAQAYACAPADVLRAMQHSDEGFDHDEAGRIRPPSLRWVMLEAMRIAGPQLLLGPLAIE